MILIYEQFNSVPERLPRERDVIGIDPKPCHTKDIIKMVPDASLLRAQHMNEGLPSLLSNLV